MAWAGAGNTQILAEGMESLGDNSDSRPNDHTTFVNLLASEKCIYCARDTAASPAALHFSLPFTDLENNIQIRETSACNNSDSFASVVSLSNLSSTSFYLTQIPVYLWKGAKENQSLIYSNHWCFTPGAGRSTGAAKTYLFSGSF